MTIVADPGARFDEVIAVIDTLRVAKEGPMFSDLQFGTPR